MRNRGLILKTRKKFQDFLQSESGATAVEYAVIMGLIAVVIAGGLRIMGGSINNVMTEASSELGKALPD